MLLRHAHTLINTGEHDYLVTLLAIITVLIAAYFRVPAWYVTHAINVIHDCGVGLLMGPAMIWKYVKGHVFVARTGSLDHPATFAHFCGHH